MRVVSKNALREFWRRRPDAQEPLASWHKRISRAAPSELDTPAKVKSQYPYSSILSNNRGVFNIKGNRYRLVAHINYESGTVYIRFIGTHAEYNRIDAEEV